MRDSSITVPKSEECKTCQGSIHKLAEKYAEKKLPKFRSLAYKSFVAGFSAAVETANQQKMEEWKKQ